MERCVNSWKVEFRQQVRLTGSCVTMRTVDRDENIARVANLLFNEQRTSSGKLHNFGRSVEHAELSRHRTLKWTGLQPDLSGMPGYTNHNTVSNFACRCRERWSTRTQVPLTQVAPGTSATADQTMQETPEQSKRARSMHDRLWLNERRWLDGRVVDIDIYVSEDCSNDSSMSRAGCMVSKAKQR